MHMYRQPAITLMSDMQNFLSKPTLRLPLAQYCVTIYRCGDSTLIPINLLMLSCVISFLMYNCFFSDRLMSRFFLMSIFTETMVPLQEPTLTGGAAIDARRLDFLSSFWGPRSVPDSDFVLPSSVDRPESLPSIRNRQDV